MLLIQTIKKVNITVQQNDEPVHACMYNVIHVHLIQVLGQFLEEALKMLETIKEGLVRPSVSPHL